jgi:hypothetical protein
MHSNVQAQLYLYNEERGLGKRTTRSIRAMQLESFKSESMIDNFSEKRSIFCERATFYNGAIRPT